MYTLEEYGNLFSKLGLTEMSVKDGDFELTLKKEAAPVKTEVVVSDNTKTEIVSEEKVTEAVLEICSPLVGVFCSSESPEAKPYVQVGDTVRKGDVVCIIEAMKMFNDVVADKDGIVKEICVENGQLVEYKQPLFKLEPVKE